MRKVSKSFLYTFPILGISGIFAGLKGLFWDGVIKSQGVIIHGKEKELASIIFLIIGISCLVAWIILLLKKTNKQS